MRYVGMYCREGQATDDNTAHANYMLDTEGYRHTLRISSTYCLFHNNNAYANAPRCYVICTLLFLL